MHGITHYQHQAISRVYAARWLRMFACKPSVYIMYCSVPYFSPSLMNSTLAMVYHCVCFCRSETASVTIVVTRYQVSISGDGLVIVQQG